MASTSLAFQNTFHPPHSSPGVNAQYSYTLMPGGYQALPTGPVVMAGVPGVPVRPSPTSMADGGGGGGCCDAIPGFTCGTFVKIPGLSTGLDPGDKYAIGDITRWYSGGMSDKVFINILKTQGAMEALGALAVPSHAAVTKLVGQANAVVSRVDPSGQQGVQSFVSMPYNKAVPSTGAVTVAPLAVSGW
jgi:hypothetical protein